MHRRSWVIRYVGFIAAAYGVSGATGAPAQPAAPLTTDAVLRVVDVGAGLCVVITVPGGHAMLYDTGPGGDSCAAAVREMVPSHHLDLIVLSHSDDDHIGGMRRILEQNDVTAIIHPGDNHPFRRRRPDQKAYIELMRNDILSEGAQVWNLADSSTPPVPGRVFNIGAASATFVAGWGDGNSTRHSDERPLPEGPRNNALSIVIRFEYSGHSVLLTGDTVGRLDFAPAATCGYAERIMVERAASVPIDSDVLVGQHHGADNASSGCFIQAVSPKYVVFSAGHVTRYHHPRQSAYDRLIANGVTADAEHILRTDRGDNEDGTDRSAEMTVGSGQCRDPVGDDDVEIRLPSSPSSTVSVNYRGASRPCP